MSLRSEPLILSSGIEVSIHELVNTIAKLMNFTGEIVFDPIKPDGQIRKPSEAETLRQFLSDFTHLSLEEDLTRTIHWFERNYPEMRI